MVLGMWRPAVGVAALPYVLAAGGATAGLRFAWLDMDLLGRAIAADLNDARRFAGIAVKPRLAITCLDQLGDGPAIYCQGGRRCQARLESLIAAVRQATDMNEVWLSRGPDRDSMSGYL